jgi:hypothetical protein
MTMKMENIWMPLPIIHIMKHITPACFSGACAAAHSAWCRRAARLAGWEQVGVGGAEHARALKVVTAAAAAAAVKCRRNSNDAPPASSP